jgi:transposase
MKTLDIQTLLETIERQSQEIALLKARIQELEKRLNKDSSNSSKPPSSDGFRKSPKPVSLREQGKRSSGGQKGHRGESLKQVPHPDFVIVHRLHRCPECQKNLAKEPAQGAIKRQVFDIPVPQVEVTEHRAEKKYCSGCHKKVISPFPVSVKAPTQYGHGIRSWVLYYQNQHFIPEDRLQQLFMDMYHLPLSTGTIATFNAEAYLLLEGFEQEVLRLAKEAPVKHLDETSCRIEAKTQWLHTMSTLHCTYYHVSAKRKSLIDGVLGVTVHDHWRPYYQLPDVEHALCNQHHLRELKAIHEQDKEEWAGNMAKLLRIMLRCRHRYGNKPIPFHHLRRLEAIYDHFVDKALTWHESLPPLIVRKILRGRPKQRPGHNLLLRLKRHKHEVLRFLHNPIVPFTNNEAERDLRMMKCKQKISGGFRSFKGAQYFARIRGFISTARKQEWNILDAIRNIFTSELPYPVLACTQI